MSMHWPSEPQLQNLNRSFMVVVLLINGFLFGAPLWPNLRFAIQTNITKPIKLTAGELGAVSSYDTSYNHIIIPRMQFDEPILEGTSETTVNRGIWRRPNTSTPGLGSNTVLVGHRFSYAGSAAFYHLDKLRAADQLIVIYDGKVRIYRVEVSKVVLPSEGSVEAATNSERLTLYTCTPLGTLKNRLVVEARLEQTL